MRTQNKKTGWIKVSISAALMLTLTGCGNMSDRIANIGQPPEMTRISNPVEQAGYQPVTIPMPDPEVYTSQPNSLWQSGRQTFFKDQRAKKVGDILTVMIEIQDEADMENKTSRSRTGSESVGVPNMLGLESHLSQVLPEAIDPTNLANMNTDSVSDGEGTIEREEEISVKLAAMVTQVLPNGNFVIQGTQQVRVNFELRELTLSGIIRPEDVLNNNSISYEKIAEARISYGGKGHLTDVQQPRYGQQLYDIVFPF